MIDRLIYDDHNKQSVTVSTYATVDDTIVVGVKIQSGAYQTALMLSPDEFQRLVKRLVTAADDIAQYRRTADEARG